MLTFETIKVFQNFHFFIKGFAQKFAFLSFLQSSQPLLYIKFDKMKQFNRFLHQFTNTVILTDTNLYQHEQEHFLFCF